MRKSRRRDWGWHFSKQGRVLGTFEQRADGLYEVRLGRTVVGVVTDRMAAEELIAKATNSNQTNMTG